MNQDDKNKLWELIQTVQVAMLTTMDEEGVLKARPMMNIQDKFDGSIYFFTKENTAKVDESHHHGEVCLSYSFPEKDIYVSVSGKAKLNWDKKKIDEFWSPMVKAWFDSKDDPDLCLLEIDVHSAEYWDGNISMMKKIYEITKANITNSKPDLGENKKIA